MITCTWAGCSNIAESEANYGTLEKPIMLPVCFGCIEKHFEIDLSGVQRLYIALKELVAFLDSGAASA